MRGSKFKNTVKPKISEEPPIVSSETLIHKSSKEDHNNLDDASLKEVSGGYLIGNKDLYTIAQYNAAGVTRQANIFSKDKYYYQGKSITQKEAEAVAYAFFNLKPKERKEEKTVVIKV